MICLHSYFVFFINAIANKIPSEPDSFGAFACVTGDYAHQIESHQKLMSDYFSDWFHLYRLFVHLNGR